ncbi:MAG: NAD(P)/FAD-dependent oxidoreductase [Hyphomicrobiaceae bacterium]
MAQTRDTIAVIGGGPAGLMAAEVLSAAGYAVTVYERMPSVGRKFLMAGRGGLNLTHSEARAAFLGRYGHSAGWMAVHLDAFPPGALAGWCEALGVPLFVGSSGRVFPETFKASPVLRAWLRRLDAQGVTLATRHTWTGWDESGALTFATPDCPLVAVRPRATVLALGGASWPRLGSDGQWLSILSHAGIEVADLHPANCGAHIAWSPHFLERFEGEPLKRIAVACGDTRVRGEAVVTAKGLEGGAVYALAWRLRETLSRSENAELAIDLRPDLELADLTRRLERPRGKQSLANFLRKAAGLSPVAIALLREDARNDPHGALPAAPAGLARRLKQVTLTVTGTPDLDRAISTAGGIRLVALDANLMLRKRPGVFAAGEMLDWEAPTGGYLLQGCFATGVAAARGVLRWRGHDVPPPPPEPAWALPASIICRRHRRAMTSGGAHSGSVNR